MKVVLDESVPLNSNNIVHTITSVGFESTFRRCLVGKPARGPKVGVKGLGFWFSGVQVFRAIGAQKKKKKKRQKKSSTKNRCQNRPFLGERWGVRSESHLVRHTSIQIAKKKLIQKHFHLKHFHPKPVSSKPVSSKTGFIQNRFHPKTVSSKSTFIQKRFRAQSTPKHPNTKTPKHQNTKTPKHQNTSTPQHQNTSTPKHLNTKTPKHQNTKTPKHLNT